MDLFQEKLDNDVQADIITQFYYSARAQSGIYYTLTGAGVVYDDEPITAIAKL
jgi:hypothetical protein